MARLGYTPIDARAARRQRRQRLLTRSVLAGLGALTLAAAVQVYQHSGVVRRPEGPTVPAALHHDLERQQQHLRGAIQIIRDRARSIEPPSTTGDGGLDPDADRSAIAPVRWI